MMEAEIGEAEGTIGKPRNFPKLSRAEWVLLLALGAGQFTNIMDFMIVIPLGSQYMREMSINTQQFGFVVAAYAIAASLAGFSSAFFIDGFDRKKSFLWLYAGFTLGTFFCAVAPNYWSLVAARSITGAFGGLVGATVLAIVGDAFSESRRGTATGVVMSAFSVATIFGVPSGLYLAGLWGWRSPF